MEAVLQQEGSKQTRGSLIQRYGSLLAILAVIVFFSIVNENFLSYANLADILRSISIVTLVAIVIPLLFGLVIGLVNAFLVVKVRIPDILATLVSLYVFQGIHLSYTQGFSIYNNMPMVDGTTAPGIIIPSFLFIGQGKLLGIPVNRYRTLAYLLSALFASIGFSIFGQGKPNALGTFCGAILMGVLMNGLTMMNVPYYAQDIVKGLVLGGALTLTYLPKWRK